MISSTWEFRWLDRNAPIEEVDDAVRRVATEVMAGASERAPIDTGTLSRSYTIVREAPASYLVGTGVHYAPFVEFGTRYTRAQPHLGPALEAARRRYR